MPRPGRTSAISNSAGIRRAAADDGTRKVAAPEVASRTSTGKRMALPWISYSRVVEGMCSSLLEDVAMKASSRLRCHPNGSGSTLDLPFLSAIEEPDVTVSSESIAFDDDAAAVTARVERKSGAPGIEQQRLPVSARFPVVREKLEIDEIEPTPARLDQADFVLVSIEGRVRGQADIGRGEQRPGREAGQHAAAIGEATKNGEEARAS
jgi:hypothetical protein